MLNAAEFTVQVGLFVAAVTGSEPIPQWVARRSRSPSTGACVGSSDDQNRGPGAHRPCAGAADGLEIADGPLDLRLCPLRGVAQVLCRPNRRGIPLRGSRRSQGAPRHRDRAGEDRHARETERQGRPYTLVCVETRATWERRLEQYGEDIAAMRRMAAAAGTVPGSEAAALALRIDIDESQGLSS